MLTGGNDVAVNDVTSPRQGYAVQLKDLDAEHVSVSVADLRVAAFGWPMFRVRVLYRLWWRGSAELLFRSPALGASQIPWMRRVSAMCQRALLSLRSSSMPLIARLLGIRLPSGLRRE
jgi:hypothetical protein